MRLAVAGVLWLALLTPAFGDEAAALRTAAEGQRLYRAGRFREAVEKYEQAHLLYPSPDLLVYLAAAHLDLREELKAARRLLGYFSEADGGDGQVALLAKRLWQRVDETARRGLLGRPNELEGPLLRKLERLAQAQLQALPRDVAELAQRLKAEAEAKAQREAQVSRRVLGSPPPAPARRRPLWPGLLMGGLGVAAAATGIALLAVHDRCAPGGDLATCPLVYDTRTGGAVTLSFGLVGAAAGGLWIGLRGH